MRMGEEYLKTKVFVHKRDEKGSLLPVDVDISEMKGKVKILPMTKGEIAKLQSEMKGDMTTEEQELIKKHILEPKFTDDDIKFFKVIEFSHLVSAIMEASGISKERIQEATKALMNKVNPL